MRKHRNEPVFHCANNALGHLGFAQIENRMNRHHYEIEFRQDFIVKIERAVAENVAFDPGE